jgi:hypothetical protein
MQGLKYFLFIFLLGIFIKSEAQDEVSKPIDGTILDLGFGFGGITPLGKLQERYGSSLNFSLGGDYISTKNWIVNSEFIYLFGDQVKEDVLAPFRTSSGVILGDDEQIADVFLRQRGLYLGLGGGKLFPLSKYSRSGIKLIVNGGILQHNIKFTDERNSVAQIRAGRHTGYDRLTRGFSIKETVGYKHLSKDRRLNFEIALDFIQGFTSEVRAYNFDTGKPTIASRLDLLVGARFVWNLAFYRNNTEATIYY